MKNKNTIKKLAALGLCAILININTIAYANVLEDLIDDNLVNNTEDVIVDEIDETKSTDNIEIETTENEKDSFIFKDIEGHWAKDWIKNSVNLGFVSGYEDGTFKPDRTITRAEFATLLNNAIKIETAKEISFSDVNKNEWFYNEVRKSVAAGFFSGYENNTFRPTAPIKREEVAKVISGAITTGNIEGEGATLLHDYNTIQEWAKQSVNSVYNKGYILGYPDKTYMPSKPLTRAEAVKIIYEIVNNENIEYGFNITNYNETYSSAVVVGDLNILDSVGNGNVYIKNVVVLGSIKISAKNIKNVELTDVKARSIIIEGENNQVKIIKNENVVITN